MLARRLRRTNDNLADLIFTDVPGRVAKPLLRLVQRFGTQEGDAVRVSHDLTQEEIAQLIGASRETVNKALADFAHRDWIRVEGKSVLICDCESLARRALTPIDAAGHVACCIAAGRRRPSPGATFRAHVPSSGILASSDVPLPAGLVMRIRPPRASTRSASPTSPEPLPMSAPPIPSS